MKVFNLVRTAGFVAGTALLTFNAGAAEADALPTFDNNFIKVSATGNNVSGSKAAYQARTQTFKDGAAGIEELRWNYDLKNNTTLQVDGRALAGQEDYLLSFKLSKEEVGSVEAGYKTFRTFYDGAGGFFPIGNTWLPIFSRELYVDRGQFFVNGTIALPKAPVFTFKFTSSTRDGRKDSTSWGDTNLTGIPIWSGPGAVNPVPATRKLLPAHTQIDEQNDAWEVGVRHKVGNTSLALSFGGNNIDNTSTRIMPMNIGELAPYPAVTYTALTQTNQRAGSPRMNTVTYAQDEEAYHAAASFETVLSDKVTLFGGLNYHTAEADIAASRLLTATIMSAVGVNNYPGGFVLANANSRAPYHVVSSGKTDLEVLTANIGARLQPLPTLYVEAALRGERFEDSGSNLAKYSPQGVTLATGAVTQFNAQGLHGLDNVEKPWTPTLDVRYSGIKNLALYASWEYRTSKQDERVRYEGFDGLTKTTDLEFLGKKIEETHSNATIGANWTPHRSLAVRAELYTKDHADDFTGYEDALGRVYNLNYDIYGTKLTLVVKPLTNVTTNTRYVLQRGKAATFHTFPSLASGVLNGSADANDSTRHMFSETITWNPTKSTFVQGNGSIVFDQIETMYPWVTGAAKTNLRNTDNNYVTADVTVGFAIDQKTDGRVQATYYRSNNYDVDYARVAMPYGASGKETSLTVGLRRKLTAKTVLDAKVGYLDSENSTRGGFADFTGPVGYVSVQHAF